MTAVPAAIQLEGVTLHYGRAPALRDINLRIHPGERVALVGANGSGKSSLLRVLHGLVSPQQGLVRATPGLAKAMLFQRPFVLRASVLHNVALGLWMKGVSWPQAQRDAHEALQMVELSGMASRNARALSGGQQQRLALARAWALKPDMLLLDEPTANLDPHAKREVEALLQQLAQQPVTLILASHNLGQVKRLASRVVYLERGQVLADLPVQDFFDTAKLQTASPAAHAFSQGETG